MKKSRNYTLNKRLDKAYENYKKMYKAQAKKLADKGITVSSKMLKKSDYKYARKVEVSEGTKNNINAKIVKDQLYMYSQKTAAAMKRELTKAYKAGDTDIDLSGWSLAKIRAEGIDLSEVNEMLKKLHPEWTGTQRRAQITHDYFYDSK